MNALKLMPFAAVASLSLVAMTTPFGQARAQERQARPKTIELSEVPPPAIHAAQKELRTAPTEARILPDTSPEEYELAAKDKAGKEVSVHVQADGTVTAKKVELRP